MLTCAAEEETPGAVEASTPIHDAEGSDDRSSSVVIHDSADDADLKDAMTDSS